MSNPEPIPETFTERYIWHVIYLDGSSLSEYETPSQHRSFRDVDISQVLELVMLPNHWLGQTGPQYHVYCSPKDNIRPVFTRQNSINQLTGQYVRYHVFGTSRTVNGANVQSLIYLEDSESPDLVVLTDRRLQTG